MKQLLIILISVLFGLNILQAQEKNPYEETTWNVIRERLFNGLYSHAFRYEEDIRIQLQGSTQADSALVISVIEELKDLIEIVDIKLVADNPNFVLNLSPSNGIGLSTKQIVVRNKIAETHIMLDIETDSDHIKRQQVQYHIIKNLTKTFNSSQNLTGYGGFFDSSRDYYDEIHEIDKDLIRKLYSNNFYEKLKNHAVTNWSYLFYLDLRYHKVLSILCIFIGIIISIVGFISLLAKSIRQEKSITFKNYFKQGIVALPYITFAYLFFWMPARLPFEIPDTNEIFSIFTVGILSILLMFLVEKIILKRFSNFYNQQIVIFFSTILSITISNSIFHYAQSLLDQGISSDPFFFFQYYALFGFTIVGVSVAATRVLFNFIKYHVQSMVNTKDVELAKMKELKNQAELNALHSRINPHFLYNSLNSIAVLAHTNPDKTENMATGLSELFRYSINRENKTFVTVAEELEMVEKYLAIEKTRFGERLLYKIEVDESARKKQIPKFLIQPIAENAIKHGLSKSKRTGEISIEVKQLEKDLIISIFDNGPDFPDEPVSGYGLQNLNDKLQIIYGNEAFINWENGENKHFRITIKDKF